MSVDGEDLVDRWERRLQQGVKTAADVTPEDCAMRFGADLDIEELCNEALQVAISAGDGKIEMAHFEEAEERLEAEAGEEDGDGAPPTIEEATATPAQEELLRRLDEFEARLDDVEQRVQTLANRDFALLKGSLRQLVDVDQGDDLDDVLQESIELREQIDAVLEEVNES